jgi:hypothetical protein
MKRKFGIMVIATAAAITMLAPAAGATTNTLTLGPITVTNRVLATVPVTVVCDPLPNDPASSQVQVMIQQAAGKGVSAGTGQVYATNGSNQPILTCDGTTGNKVVVSVTPSSGSGPFHSGGAVLTATFMYTSGTSCGNGCFFNTTTESGSLGPIPVKMRG